jgi:hypothetical protein
VAIPEGLQDAMSRQAQAERTIPPPCSCAMNITYEITKERGAIILIPTSMGDSLNPAITLALVNQKVERMAKAA